MIFLMFSTIVGAISFWGSIVAFGKLQELISGRPIKLPGQQVINGLILLAVLGRLRLPRGRRPGDNEPMFIARPGARVAPRAC